MDTVVISGFPCVGKSTLKKQNRDWADSDSSQFSWKKNAAGELELDGDGKKIRNPNFAAEYLEHIQGLMGKVPVIFVSTHKDTRALLIENEIPFTLVYPEKGLIDEYQQRLQNRGSPQGLIDIIIGNWDNFVGECEAQTGCPKIVLKRGQYMSDVIGQIVKQSPPAPKGEKFTNG